MTKIYTKTGDKGETGIIGKRLSKNSHTINTLGSFDELNASIGIIISTMNEKTEIYNNEIDFLHNIQNTLFNIGGLLANGKVEIKFSNLIQELENQIDSYDKNLEPLQNFILPGGSLTSAHIHLSRAICRRVERVVVNLEESDETKIELVEIKKYINRLSDYLFVLARVMNVKSGVSDIKWLS